MTLDNDVNRVDDSDFHILALSGGGYRGLYTAHVLERLEEETGRPIGQCFDLIAGTSIGGIIALAIAFEVPMRRVVETFKEDGQTIFPPKSKLAGLFASRFRTEPLKNVIAGLIDHQALLSDARHALLIPTLNLTTGKQQILKTRHHPDWVRDHKYAAIDVALATAAAPIYFPVAEIDNQLFADGGLFANAPDLVALHEASKFFGKPDNRVRMLSIGTLSSRYSMPHGRRRDMGVAHWLKPSGFPLLRTILSAQQQFSNQLVQHRLGDQYLRIDNTPMDDVMRNLNLDNASYAARDALLGWAAKDVSDVMGTAPIKQFLAHTPGQWIIKES
ncbi:patatin [Dyella dinghuensis]|uniref:Patatin n=1 Tax=Dyella dinghuensis TaxID=1920169 RepID=A0A432LW59_9GAMM|nr:CBASS cGAMP-activated phospholipase [Dyella dinghuensis]RUL65799.1 patatin [Dyella dinghuensis]